MEFDISTEVKIECLKYNIRQLPIRSRKILEVIFEKEGCCQKTICQRTFLKQNVISQSLKRLEKQGFIYSKKVGREVLYYLQDKYKFCFLYRQYAQLKPVLS